MSRCSRRGLSIDLRMHAIEAKGSSNTAFIGHPVGLAWLSASEFWERFSYYGMQTLLVLYLTHYLLQPGRIEQVWGFSAFSELIGWVYGQHSKMALASNTAQLYAGLVFLTPLAGSLLADRVFGRMRTVTAGAMLMVAGSFLLAVNATFLVALLLLLIGVGCFKGNIASQVGDLYGVDDPRRAGGFQLYYLGIQIAVILSPFICGTLGQKVDWHLGFIAAGVGMLAGLATYLVGRPSFAPEPVRRSNASPARQPLKARDWQVVTLLIALLPVLALALVGNQEMFDAYLVWAEKNYQLVYFGHAIPVTWIISLESLVSTGTLVLVIAFWRWYGKRWKEPAEITKMVIGVIIASPAPLVLAAASANVAATGHPVSLLWALGFHVPSDVGISNVVPVGVALYSRVAPKGLNGTMIAVCYLHLFIGTVLVGYLGGLLGTMSNVRFWTLHAGLMAVSAVLLILARMCFGQILTPSSEVACAASA